MAATTSTPSKNSDWKTPLRKLVRVFQTSRDQWKEKHAQAKAQCKYLSNQVRAVEKSREKWKQDAKQAQLRVRELEKELAQAKKQTAL